MRFRINAALEGWINLIMGSEQATIKVMGDIKRIFPQINDKSEVVYRKVSGIKKPGLCKVGYAVEYVPIPTAAPRPGIIAKLWRFWWVVWSHNEPMSGVLWDRGWYEYLPDMRIERPKWIKFERFEWSDKSLWGIQQTNPKPQSLLLGYDPDTDTVYT